MFFGDPYKFAIQCDIIPEWNDDYFWVNGVFNIYIDGESVFSELYTSELKFTLANITEDILNDIVLVNDNFSLDNDFIQKNNLLPISSPEMEDNAIFVYVFFSKKNDHIFFSKEGKELYFEYEKGYVRNILYSLLKWKKEMNYLDKFKSN
ncbi:TPA: hypothetical protein PXE99_001841 [Mannheimia haemolytica]|nr:hypothetical protein [Mannheimia haemolytica]